jgi:hypothetical protein
MKNTEETLASIVEEKLCEDLEEIGKKDSKYKLFEVDLQLTNGAKVRFFLFKSLPKPLALFPRENTKSSNYDSFNQIMSSVNKQAVTTVFLQLKNGETNSLDNSEMISLTHQIGNMKIVGQAKTSDIMKKS